MLHPAVPNAIVQSFDAILQTLRKCWFPLFMPIWAVKVNVLSSCPDMRMKWTTVRSVQRGLSLIHIYLISRCTSWWCLLNSLRGSHKFLVTRLKKRQKVASEAVYARWNSFTIIIWDKPRLYYLYLISPFVHFLSDMSPMDVGSMPRIYHTFLSQYRNIPCKICGIKRIQKYGTHWFNSYQF